MTRRRSMTGKARLALLKAHNATCHLCSGEIQTGQAWEVEHIIPIAMGGEDEPANMRPAHAKCHAVKTKADVTAIAKAKRCETKHAGAKASPTVKISSRGFPAPTKANHGKLAMPPRRSLFVEVPA